MHKPGPTIECEPIPSREVHSELQAAFEQQSPSIFSAPKENHKERQGTSERPFIQKLSWGASGFVGPADHRSSSPKSVRETAVTHLSRFGAHPWAMRGSLLELWGVTTGVRLGGGGLAAMSRFPCEVLLERNWVGISFFNSE
jgi:hypothetical protein